MTWQATHPLGLQAESEDHNRRLCAIVSATARPQIGGILQALGCPVLCGGCHLQHGRGERSTGLCRQQQPRRGTDRSAVELLSVFWTAKQLTVSGDFTIRVGGDCSDELTVFLYQLWTSMHALSIGTQISCMRECGKPIVQVRRP